MSDTREIGRFYVTLYCGPNGPTDRTRVEIGSVGGGVVDAPAADALKIARAILGLAHERRVCDADCPFNPCASDE